jgi:diguanylate cyclase
MKDFIQINSSFSNLISIDSPKIAIWMLNAVLACISELIADKISDDIRWLNAEAATGITNNEFKLHYQPIVQLSDRQVVGFEGLIRWQHPTEGLIGPGDFLDKLCSSTMLLITLEVAKMACKRLWHLDESLWLAINLSPYDIQNRGFLGRFTSVVDWHGTDVSRLRLEISEDAILNESWMLQVLNSLKAKGHRIEVDDFGVGHTSLGVIASYPISVIKIDKSLVDGIPGNPLKERVFKAILNMAETLEFEVIAEGVEREEQAEWLNLNGCGYGQGYFFGVPQSM